MKIMVERPKRTLEQTFEGKASELLEMLELPAEEVIVIRNGTLVTEDEVLADTDEIELLSVISGG